MSGRQVEEAGVSQQLWRWPPQAAGRVKHVLRRAEELMTMDVLDRRLLCRLRLYWWSGHTNLLHQDLLDESECHTPYVL